MIACARAVTLAGLEPVFVDCGDDLLMVPHLFDNNWLPTDVKAIMAVHIYGRQCDMESVNLIARYNDDMPVIEDLAEAHGVKPHQSTDAACWSFYRNKIIAGEEGGAVAFKNPDHAALARQLRSLGFTDAHDFNHVPRGHNYRMSNVHARLIIDSLGKVGVNLMKRRAAEAEYNALCPTEWRMPPRDAPWVYDIKIPGMTADRQTELVRRLNDAGIAARHAFKPLSSQPEYREARYVGTRRAYALAREVIYLPLMGAEPQKAFLIILDTVPASD